MQLREIRLRDSAPNVGVPVFAARRETSTFAVGVDGVTSIALDDAGVVTILATLQNPDGTSTDHWLVLPFTACKWAKPEVAAPVAPVAKTESKQSGRQKAR